MLLAAFLLVPVTGCGKSSSDESSEPGESADNPNTRYASLMGVKNFKETFKPRGRMTDQAKSSESAEEESPVSLLVRNVDGDANVFYYIDATGTVDLEDLAKEEYIPDFQKQLNDNSDTYQYRQMELLDRGANYWKFKVSIEDKDTEEELSAEEETTSEKKSGSKNGTASKKDPSAKKDTNSKDGAASGEESEDTQVEEDSKPMLFFYIEKGKKVYEIIGLDMEAEDAAAFSESFQGILDEIVTVKEVEPKEEAA